MITIAVASMYFVLPDGCVYVRVLFCLVHSLLVLVSVFFSIQLYCSDIDMKAQLSCCLMEVGWQGNLFAEARPSFTRT